MATQFVAAVRSAWTGTRGAGSVGVSNDDNWDMAERELEDRLSIPRYRTPYGRFSLIFERQRAKISA